MNARRKRISQVSGLFRPAFTRARSPCMQNSAMKCANIWRACKANRSEFRSKVMSSGQRPKPTLRIAIACAEKCTAAIARGSATVAEHDGRITGYGTIIGFFGHAVGETNKDVKALIGAAKEFAGPGLLLPTRNGELFRWCLGKGLRVTQPMTLMSRGLYNEPAGAFLPSILY